MRIPRLRRYRFTKKPVGNFRKIWERLSLSGNQARNGRGPWIGLKVMIDKISHELSKKMAMLIDRHLVLFKEKRGIGFSDMIENCHASQEVGSTVIIYYYKYEEIFRIYLEICENTISWKVDEAKQ